MSKKIKISIYFILVLVTGLRAQDKWSLDECVAYALEHNCKIVTYETSRPNMKRRIKIPEACDQFSIPFTDTIGMMRELGVRF